LAKPDDIPAKDYISCDTSGYIYLLGPVIVPGSQISSASPVNLAANGTGGGWAVSLSLKSSGQTAWAKYTGANHYSVGQSEQNPSVTDCNATASGSTVRPCSEFVAFTLDSSIVSVPHNNDAINGGATQISGSFTQGTAKTLANQLSYGALPVTFGNPLSQTTVSATLGSGQLKAGLLAGGIGLLLVVVYSLIYYRALGLVTIASLLVSGGLTYASLVILGRQIGFTLSLAGIAGFIVAVGITADSFVVFFERIKDEVHEGRSARTAVPRAWVRARRTILSADTVSFLAAAVLYYFAAGDVKGFAFTLGLSTILDLVVVFLFTHPLVSFLSRSRAFGSARFTGLNSARVGGIVVSEQQQREDRDAARRLNPPVPKRARGAQTASTVAVLDDEEPIIAEDDLGLVDDSVEATELPDIDGDGDDSMRNEPDIERVRTVPESGSAAERAAARRAKMRAEAADEKGQI
jgi:preprotein translocase subunit SecD